MPLTLYRRGEIWHYRGSVAGRRLRGSTRTARKDLAQRIAAGVEETAWKSRLDGPAAVLTFAQAAILYRNAGKSERFLRPLEDYFRDTPVRDLNAGAIRQAALVLYPAAGPATRNRQAIVPAQAVINHAAEHELCPRIRVKRFPTVRRKKRPATWEWVQAFMAAAGTPHLAALACFMFLTGARISQALAVTWDDVDLAAGLVRIAASGKGDDERYTHMPAALVAALANIAGARKGPVFRFRSRSNARTQWAGAIRRAGIAALSYHRCRHGFATGLLDKGVSPITVAARGGWKDARHVFETYGHDVAAATVTDLLVPQTDTPLTHMPDKRAQSKR